MTDKLKRFARYLLAYRFYGLFLYAQIFWLKRCRVHLRGYGSIYIRKGTFDHEIFTQMFIYQQYNFEVHGEVKIIIDLGGNNGLSARYFHKKYPNAVIYVLEPDTENFKALRHQTDGVLNIKVFNLAIWKENGKVNLDSGDSWNIKVDMQNGKNLAEAVTMKTFLSTNGIEAIDILKVDVEGAEKEVFESDPSFLKITRNLVIELHDWMKPGCAEAFFRALQPYSYTYSLNHENTLITGLRPFAPAIV